MSLKNYTDEQYYAGFEGGDQPDDFDGLGGYQYVKLPEIIDNFLLTYAGEGTILGGVPHHKALFHAQRAIAELSYDVARPIKSFEYELVGSLVVPLPTDYVSLNGVFIVDDNGVKHQLRERTESDNPKSPLQDENGDYLYGADGEILYNSTSSETEERYVDATKRDSDTDLADYYALRSPYAIDDFGGVGGGQRGRRYGMEPQFANINGTYVLDDNKGLLTLDNKATDKIILVDYITDGLNEDIEDIKIHKFLEDAVYMYMASKIAKGMPISPNDKAMLDKDYALAKRRGKHRLSKINANELIFTLRNRNKWIKT